MTGCYSGPVVRLFSDGKCINRRQVANYCIRQRPGLTPTTFAKVLVKCEWSEKLHPRHALEIYILLWLSSSLTL